MAETGCVVDKDFYFVANNYPWICKMNTDTYEITIISVISLDGVDIDAGLYIMGAYYKEHLVLIPRFGTSIIDYDIKQNKFEFIYVDCLYTGKNISRGGMDIKFRSSIKDGEILWLMPQSCKHIIAYNMETRRYIDYTEWYSCVEKYEWENVNLFGFGEKIKDEIFIPCYNLNAVVVFNILTGNACLCNIGESYNCYNTIKRFKDGYMLVDSQNKEILYYKNKKILKKTSFANICNLDKPCFDKIEYEKYLISNLVTLNNGMLGIPCTGNNFIYIDENINVFGVTDKIGGAAYLHIHNIDHERMLCFSQSDNNIMELNIKKLEFSNIKAYILVDKSVAKYYINRECNGVTLVEFLESLL